MCTKISHCPTSIISFECYFTIVLYLFIQKYPTKKLNVIFIVSRTVFVDCYPYQFYLPYYDPVLWWIEMIRIEIDEDRP